MDTVIRSAELIQCWPDGTQPAMERLHASRRALPRDLAAAKIIGFMQAFLALYDELERPQSAEERAYTEASIKLAVTRLRVLNAEYEATR